MSANRDSEETMNRLARAREELNKAREESARARDEVEKAKQDLEVAKKDISQPNPNSDTEEKTISTDNHDKAELTKPVEEIKEDITAPSGEIGSQEKLPDSDHSHPEEKREEVKEGVLPTNLTEPSSVKEEDQPPTSATDESHKHSNESKQTEEAVETVGTDAEKDDKVVDDVDARQSGVTQSASSLETVQEEEKLVDDKPKEEPSSSADHGELQAEDEEVHRDDDELEEGEHEEEELEGEHEEGEHEEGEHEEDETVEGEREEGDGEESGEDGAPAKPLDDDEDRRNPQYIPKRGGFYEHDDRTREEGEEPAP